MAYRDAPAVDTDATMISAGLYDTEGARLSSINQLYALVAPALGISTGPAIGSVSLGQLVDARLANLVLPSSLRLCI